MRRSKAKRFLLKAIYRYFPDFMTSKMLINYLKCCDCSIGEHTIFYNAGRVSIDVGRPPLLSIGDFCKITSGVSILTHDYSRSVLRRTYGNIIAEAKKTVIGDNVFIGIKSIILMGTHIGNNCIVGAGSVCSGKYPDNVVIAGNPAKVICTLEEYYKKRESLYESEAKEYARMFYGKYGRKPTVKEMGAFFPLYLERSREAIANSGVQTNLGGDLEDDVIASFLKTTPKYESYDAFLKEALLDEKDNCNYVRLSE